MERHPMRPEGTGDPLVIGWIGTRSGFCYLHTLDDVWRELQRRHGVVLRVVSNGDYEADGLRVENIRWSLGREVEMLHSFDVGVMPLIETPFERGKAGFKLLQCMAVGLPTVASPVGVNRTICGEDESRGLLARTPEEWRDRLERLITDPALRRRLGEAGRGLVLERYGLSRAVESWASLLHEVVDGTDEE
jgi:glycosyltransferase involved in cell wall biosynthesis